MPTRTRVSVIGAGLMGRALALDFALGGQPVRITDADPAQLADLLPRLRSAVRPLIQASILDAETAATVVARIHPSPTLREAAHDATYVVEAISERLEAKQQLFVDLEQVAPDDAVFASNTSGLRATQLAAGLAHPERLIVAHYFNPPYLIPVVEVVPGAATAPATVDATCDVLRAVGKRPVVLRREVPGFIANRLQAALLREAIHLVETDVATAEDVDAIIRGAVGRRLSLLGPFQVLDFAGVDVWADIGAYLFDDLDCSARAQVFLESLVAKGRRGVKAGAGVFDWPPEAAARLAAARDRELLRCVQRDRESVDRQGEP